MTSFLMVNFTAKLQREHSERGRRIRLGKLAIFSNKLTHLRKGERYDDKLLGAFDWYHCIGLDDLERPIRTLLQQR